MERYLKWLATAHAAVKLAHVLLVALLGALTGEQLPDGALPDVVRLVEAAQSESSLNK